MRYQKVTTVLLVGCVLVVLGSCSSSRQFTLAPIKTFDPDNEMIPHPKELEENQIWDIVDMTLFYQVEKALDLGWTARKLGRFLHVAKGREADNVNVLDEVPNSSWYTNRHFHTRMSLEELARGPCEINGPDQTDSWTITRGKFEGGTPGFTIRDARDDRYLIKFDAPLHQEMGSSAEAISTRILYACGYTVPQNTAEYFDPKILQIGETAQVLYHGVKRQMNQQDLDDMLRDTPRREDGKIRVLASKFVPGVPVGVWNYRGRRRDDPNDLVAHEHRRELRGLRVIGSWLNDADRRAANTLAVYVEENGKKFIKHYLIDMGSTLGSNNKFPHAPKYGYEYLVDPRTIGLSFIALGGYVKPWEFEQGHIRPRYPSVGYFESKMFDPGSWVPTYPNPAFEYCTLRDAYWGARLVMNFTDEDIRAIVENAKMSDDDAAEYLISTLIERRDKIGHYWFSRMNPLDRFRLESTTNGSLSLVFSDLAVDGNLNSDEESYYIYTIHHEERVLQEQHITEEPFIPLSLNGQGVLDSFIDSDNVVGEEDKIFNVRIRTQRHGGSLSKTVEVYFHYSGRPSRARIVGIVREE